MAFGWALPKMSASHVTSCMCHIHAAASVDFYCSSGDTPRYVWALSNVGQIQKHTYFFSRSLNKSVSMLSVLCFFTSLQRTGLEGLSVAGRVFLFNVTVKYLRVWTREVISGPSSTLHLSSWKSIFKELLQGLGMPERIFPLTFVHFVLCSKENLIFN